MRRKLPRRRLIPPRGAAGPPCGAQLRPHPPLGASLQRARHSAFSPYKAVPTDRAGWVQLAPGPGSLSQGAVESPERDGSAGAANPARGWEMGWGTASAPLSWMRWDPASPLRHLVLGFSSCPPGRGGGANRQH